MKLLIDCVLRGDLDSAIAAMSDGASVDERDTDGRTALIHAAIDGKEDFVEAFLAGGADIDAQDDLGYSALHYAAQGYFPELVATLIDLGAKVDIEDADGNTPLARATFSSNGRGAVIEHLLRAGADPHHTNRHDQTPAGLADMISNYDVKQFFENA